MSIASFSIAYEGEATREGAMDVRHLAPSLLSVARLFEAANSTLYGRDSAVTSVNVVATRRGSVEILLEVVWTLTGALQMLSSTDRENALQLVAYVFGIPAAVGISLFRLIKILEGRAIERSQPGENETVTLVVGDNSIVVSDSTFRLFQERDCLLSLRELVEPTRFDGIDSMRIRTTSYNGEVIEESVSKEQRRYFDRDLSETTEIGENTFRALYTIVAPVFRSGLKWRLHDGAREVPVIMGDECFARLVEQGRISFSNGDALLCDMRMRQGMKGGRLTTEYSVERVVGYRPADHQLDLL